MGKKQIGKTDEQVESLVASLVDAGDKLSWTYDEQNSTLTVDTSALDSEEVEDHVSSLVAAGTGLSVTYDDANSSLTIEVPDGAISSTELNFDPATSGDVDAVSTALSDHESDSTNPHGVTDEQTGAADARTDLRFALYPEEVDASTRDSYYNNFSKFADSAAMTSIAASSTVMDEVSASQTARDAIGTSGVGYDAIAQVAMAIGKYAAGIAGLTPTNYADIDAVASDADAMDAVSTSTTAMDAVSTSTTAMDAVSTSTTAMDAVSTSTTAMDAVSASLLAYSAALKSDYAISSLWASTPGAKTILKNSGANSLPYTPSVSGSATFSVDDGTAAALPGNAAHQLYLEVTSGENLRYEQTYSVDLSGAGTLKVTDKNPSTYGTPYYYGISVDGTDLYHIGTSTSSFTQRSFDISSYGGTHDIDFFIENFDSGYSGQQMSAVWSNVELV